MFEPLLPVRTLRDFIFMANLIEHNCTRCGGIDEANFIMSGPHVNQVCLHCGAYVKFYTKGMLPSVAEIRTKIWAESRQNIDIINKAKQITGYFELPDDPTAYTSTWPKVVLEILQWWKVYLSVRSLTPSNQ